MYELSHRSTDPSSIFIPSSIPSTVDNRSIPPSISTGGNRAKLISPLRPSVWGPRLLICIR